MTLLLLLSAAFGAPPLLTIDITNVAAQPLPSTIVRFHAEGKVRLVPRSGRFIPTELALPDGTTRPVAVGDRLVLDIWAPGYAPTTMTVTLDKPKNNRARVLLAPARFDAMGDAYGEAALQATAKWEEAQLRWFKDPSEANRASAAKLRTAAAKANKLWFDAMGRDPGTDAARLCRITTTDPKACGATP